MADTTAQEQTSAWIFRRALNENKKYKNADDIWLDPNFKKEVIGTNTKPGIYPDINEEWVENYYKQQKKFLDEFSDAKFTEFSQDQKDTGGFMNFISTLVNKKYKINKKDSWDPADIWCVQNEKQIISEIKKVTDEDKGLSGIEKLNTILRTLFKERKVVGISLKLVSGNVARYQEVNIKKGALFTSGKHPFFDIQEIKCDLKLNTDGRPKSTNTTIKIKIDYSNESVIYNFIIREHPNDPGGNLTFSFQGVGHKAQIGSIPLNLLSKRLQLDSFKFVNDWNKYPNDLKSFDTNLKEYKKMFNKIKTKVETGINNEKEFEKNMFSMFSSKDTKNQNIAHTKCMQISFLYDLVSLNDMDMNKLTTDIFYLAEKRGEGFGPFGKLY
jgi:hypothetical protein